MLTEKRQALILKILDENGSITVAQLRDRLNNISESTIRRDLTALDKAGKLVKVFGGAVALESDFFTAEPSVKQKEELYREEKLIIARKAASLIEPNDFVYLDAGTTTGSMIGYITESTASFVTNAVRHAQLLAAAGLRVWLIGGELKAKTEAVIGSQALLMLQGMHFSKAFLGTNGVSQRAGFSTPDYEEALIKKTAAGQAKKVYVLADHSKLGNITSATFAEFERADLITDAKPPEKFSKCKNIIVVD